jgi:hypothetical protein
MELNLFDSLMSNEDQLALSAVNWPHLGHVNLNCSGIFDRPCALFLKKWLHTISDAMEGPVIIDISSNSIDLLTLHYCCKWMKDTRLIFLRLINPSMSSHPMQYLARYLEYNHYLRVHHMRPSCQWNIGLNYLAYRMKMGFEFDGGFSENEMHSIMRDIAKNPRKYCTGFHYKIPELESLLSTCPMEQDWYIKDRVKLVLKKPRTSGRGNMSIFSRESSY